MMESKNFSLPELQNHLNLEHSLYVWCLHKFVVVHSWLMSNVSMTWGPTICQKEGLSVEDMCPPTKKFLVVSVCVSSCWGEVIWKPLNISAGIFPSPFGNRQQHLSGEISFALSQSEKFLRGILVLGMRNQTQLIPSGPMPLIKTTEVQFSWSSLRPWGGAGAVEFSEFHLWLRPFLDSAQA